VGILSVLVARKIGRRRGLAQHSHEPATNFDARGPEFINYGHVAKISEVATAWNAGASQLIDEEFGGSNKCRAVSLDLPIRQARKNHPESETCFEDLRVA
jgi:hypothetical protein